MKRVRRKGPIDYIGIYPVWRVVRDYSKMEYEDFVAAYPNLSKEELKIVFTFFKKNEDSVKSQASFY